MCYVCRNHKPVRSLNKIDHWDYSKNKSTDDTGGGRTINPFFGHLSSNPVFVKFVLLNI